MREAQRMPHSVMAHSRAGVEKWSDVVMKS